MGCGINSCPSVPQNQGRTLSAVKKPEWQVHSRDESDFGVLQTVRELLGRHEKDLECCASPQRRAQTRLGLQTSIFSSKLLCTVTNTNRVCEQRDAHRKHDLTKGHLPKARRKFD
eukprot:5638260-Pleurochrysis_carterae.AAC.4